MTAPDWPARREDQQISDRSRGLTLVFAFFGGVFGFHRFYTGRVQSGVAMLVTLGGMGLWYLYDLVLIVAGEFTDAEGRRVTRWEVGDVGGAPNPGGRRVEGLEERIEMLESQLSELAERVDFAERMLSQQRDKGQLPRG